MTRYISILLSMLMFAACSGNQHDDPMAEISPSEDIQKKWTLSTEINLDYAENSTVDSLNRFSYDLMKAAVAEYPDAEVCVSPLSMAICLSMLANVTDGTCRQQILNTLHIPDTHILNSLINKLLHYLPSEDFGAALDINNHFWIANRYNVPLNVISLMAETFNAPLEYKDFSSPTTVAEINQWVDDKTKGLIPSILDKDWKTYLNTACICVNTSYFKGYWDSRFPKDQTRNEKFQSPFGKVEVNMMHQELMTGYAEDSTVRMITLSFEDNVYQMELYLPREDVEAASMISHLTPERQNTLLKSSKPYQVDIALPSFSTRKDTQAKLLLEKLGISTLDNVDLSPIGLDANPIDILHKTCLKIDESGAEGAAATCSAVGALIQTPELTKTSIHFNRPFLYIVRNTRTNTILFSGIITNPQ